MRIARRIAAGVRRRLGLPSMPAFPREVEARFRRQLAEIRARCPRFAVIEEFRDESRAHPVHYRDFECEFASEQVRRCAPGTILDVGSYRAWLAGLMAHYRVTTVDVRERHSDLANETCVTQDVRYLTLESESVDMVTTLHTIEHFGLGRYGDEFDPDGDCKAVKSLLHMIRPGGRFLFSVPVTAGTPCLAFNSHRIYSLDMVRGWVADLARIEERFIKRKPARICEETELATSLGEFDIYCACYEKPCLTSKIVERSTSARLYP